MADTEKVRSKVLELLLDKIEQRKNDPNYKKPKRKTPTKDWQIGFLTGEFIISNYLTSIKGVGIEFNKSVEMSEEDSTKYKVLSDKWLKSYREKTVESNNDWIAHREFDISMEEKYLPKELKCYVPLIVVDNVKELKSGIRTSLWDCDGCTYEIENDEDILVEDNDIMSDTWTSVTLRLDTEKTRKDLYEKYGKIS